MLSGRWEPGRDVAAEAPKLEETPLAPDDVAADDDDTAAAVAGVALAPLAAVAVAPLDLRRRAEPRDLLRLYLMACATPKTRRTRLQGLERCAAAIGADAQTLPWHELRTEHTTAIRAALIARAYKKATIESALWALRGILGHAEQLGFLSFDDYRRATKLAPIGGEELPAGRALSRDEIAQLRVYCTTETGLYGRFLEAVFALLLGVGMRATEACTMPIAGYDAGERVVRLRRKGNKNVELPVDRRAGLCLDAWMVERLRLREKLSTDALLVRVQKNDWPNERTPQMTDRTLEYILKCVAADAGVAHFTPHDLRRTFCTMLLDANVNLATAQRLMSHSDPKTTVRYDRREAERMAQARRDVEIW